jgi:amino acid transporter
MATLNNRTGAHPAGTSPSQDSAGERENRSDENDDRAARDKFGGLNIGAAFFGWLVAIAITILLISIVGAVLAGIGSTSNITQSDAQRSAGTIGLSAGIVLLVVLTLAYFTGGYVAGRMSRFDGARQGIGVWVIGLLVTLIALALGAIFGAQYNILDRVDLPRIPVSTDQLGWGGVITAVLVLVLTLLGAALGGVVGHRYHNRVDRAAHR